MKFFKAKQDLPPGTAERVPPGQYLTEKWPVLHYGSVPRFDPKTWDFRVFGKVENEVKMDWEEFKKLDQTLVQADMHCVTTWSRLDQKWEGIPFAKIVELAKPLPEAKFVIAHSEHGFTANIPIEYCLRDDCLIALRANGEPLTAEHGCPRAWWSRACTRGRARSGYAASSSPRPTSRASGSATAITTPATPGKRSATGEMATKPRRDLVSQRSTRAPLLHHRGAPS